MQKHCGWDKATNDCAHSPEPYAEVYCLRLKFSISKLRLFQTLGSWGRAKTSEKKNGGGLRRGLSPPSFFLSLSLFSLPRAWNRLIKTGLFFCLHCFRAKGMVSVVSSIALLKGVKPFMRGLTRAATWSKIFSCLNSKITCKRAYQASFSLNVSGSVNSSKHSFNEQL